MFYMVLDLMGHCGERVPSGVEGVTSQMEKILLPLFRRQATEIGTRNW
jgi:hypothetical protein